MRFREWDGFSLLSATGNGLSPANADHNATSPSSANTPDVY